MSSDTAMVAIGLDHTDHVIVAMSARIASAHEEDAYEIEGFLEEGCPRAPGLWVWEGTYEDDDANGEWRRPTIEELEELHGELT